MLRAVENQSAHDRCVASTASANRKMVATHLNCTRSPSVFERVVVEVETGDSAGKPHALAQAAAFRRAEAEDPNTSFRFQDGLRTG